MQLTGEQIINAPREKVWDALNDPEILRQCIPGCKSLERDGDRMEAVVAIKIGPIGAKFNGNLAITDQVAPASCTIEGEGQGGNAGVAKGKADVELKEADGGTLLSYDVAAEVGGRLAQVGGALIDATAKRLAGAFFKKFGEIVERPAEDSAAAEAPSGTDAPSSTAAAAASSSQADHVPAYASASASASPSTPYGWIMAVALAALIGFLVGRGDGGGSEWMAIAIALLLLGVAAAAFQVGRRSGAPLIQIDARQFADILRGERK